MPSPQKGTSDTSLRQDVLVCEARFSSTDRFVHGDSIMWFIFLPSLEKADIRYRPLTAFKERMIVRGGG